VKVLLLSTYELGHQPIGLATAAGGLIAAGHRVRSVDLSLGPMPAGDVEWADAVAVSVPMHTATRLAAQVVEAVRALRSTIPAAAFGLYAGAEEEDHHFDATFAGEYESELVAWIGALEGSDGRVRPPRQAVRVDLGRRGRPSPDRSGLPGLERYGRLLVDGQERLVGYTEASRGCSHRCRHCPVPVVYDGRTRMVDVGQVAADVDQLVAAGAEHITFGDPDFLNGPQQAMRVVRRLAADHPGVTCDATVKVEHVLRHRELWPEMRAAGLIFIVSAFESVNDAVLARLAKNHTAAGASEAVSLLRAHDIEIRPSWLPFTPWTEIADVVELVNFVIDNDLVANVDPVQYSIRLLVPPGSLLLGEGEDSSVFGPYDPAALTHPWRSPHPSLDRLASHLGALAEASADLSPRQGFIAVHGAVDSFARTHDVERPRPVPPDRGRMVPRLSEPWFCCAEPTLDQSNRVGSFITVAGGGAS
jgi:radical SAM superfamily enzyme YgiQ (UPF0313 family)